MTSMETEINRVKMCVESRLKRSLELTENEFRASPPNSYTGIPQMLP